MGRQVNPKYSIVSELKREKNLYFISFVSVFGQKRLDAWSRFLYISSNTSLIAPKREERWNIDASGPFVVKNGEFLTFAHVHAIVSAL